LKQFGVILFALSLVAPAAKADSAAPIGTPPPDVLDRYLEASQESATAFRGYSMAVDIQAQLPKLKKQGHLQALRHISKIGRVTYDALKFAGDNTIKTNVIARYLTAEVQAQGGTGDLSISPANYKFKYKGLANREGRQLHVFEVKPHKKRVGLFKGEVWVDPDTYLPVREAGQFVKNPSLFLKKVEFTREYDIRDGVAFPARIASIVDTRLVGKAQINITFSNFSRAETDESAALAIAEEQ
jgi:hypothetical protein